MRASRREVLKFGVAALLGAGLAGACRRRLDRPHVLLMTLDTTRADRLGCYGYSGATSPSIDMLASESVLFTHAIAPSSWTLPSHASLFTGKFPQSHGAGYDAEGSLRITDAIAGPAEWTQYRVRGLAEKEATLAALLKGAGYRTGAVVGGPWMKRIFGLAGGFDYFDDDGIDSVKGRRAEAVTTRAVGFVERAREEPFLLFLNYFDPHAPYAPPQPFVRPGDQVHALYEGEIRYMDHHIGRFFERLKALDLYDRTFIVVTADHGELLGEHGKLGHGDDLYQEELHVPFLLKYPYGETSARTTDAWVQLVDVLPLILERLGLGKPPSVQGGVPPRIGHPVFAEVSPLPFFSGGGNWRALFHFDYKYLWNSKGNHLLFNLKDDPAERENLLTREPERARSMDAALARYANALPREEDGGPPRAIDEETLRTLRSLGYVR